MSYSDIYVIQFISTVHTEKNLFSIRALEQWQSIFFFSGCGELQSRSCQAI